MPNELRIPEELDEESYISGFQDAIQIVLMTVQSISIGQSDSEPEHADTSSEEDCPECGGLRFQELGSDGYVCPNCDR